MKRVGVVLILLLAFFGIADSAYIAQNEVAGQPLLCGTRGLTGCNIVAASSYSYVFGIPVAEYGMLFYAILLALAALELVLFDEVVRRVLFWFSLAGVAASLYLFFIEVFAIHAYCIYCIVSMVLSLLIAALVSFIHISQRAKRPLITPPPVSPPLLMPPLR